VIPFPNFANSVFERGGPGSSMVVFTLLIRRNIWATSALIAKLIFCGMSPVTWGDAESIELLHYDAKKSTTLIEQRATAIASLHRGGDLQLLKVVLCAP
jgi:hypothetical protein